MAINDMGEQAMAAQKAREANTRRIQQQTMPRTGANAATPGDALQNQARAAANNPARGPAADIRSRAPAETARMNPVDRDFAQARAEQAARFEKPAAPASARPTGRIASTVDKIKGIGEMPVGQAARSTAAAIPEVARSTVNTAKVAGKGLVPLAVLGGTAETFMQPDTAQRDFEESVGVESPLGAAGAGITRLFTNIGNAVTFGQAEKVGRGLSSLAGGSGFMSGYSEPTMAERSDAAPSQQRGISDLPVGQPIQKPDQAVVQQNAQAMTSDKQDAVVGSFNGKPLTQSMVADAGARANVVDGPAAQPVNNAKSITDGLLGRMDSQDAAFSNLVKGNVGRRDDRAARSEERLSKLQGMFETAMFQGKRRSAAVIAQAMQAEGQNMSALSGGNIPDIRRNTPIDPNAAANEGKIAADAAESNARAGKDLVETSRQKRINDLMGAYLDNPDSEAGQKALSNLNAVQGNSNRKVMSADYPLGIDEFGTQQTAKILVDDQGNQVFNPFAQGQQAGSQLPAGAARIAGYDRKTGKPVYEDAEGNQVIEE